MMPFTSLVHWPCGGSLGAAALWVFLLSSMVMTLLWTRQRSTRNATSVDVAWAALLAATGIIAAALGSAPWPRRLLLAVLVGAWGLRLAGHLLGDRVGAAEDGRYAAARRAWGEQAQRNFFWLYQVQAALVAVLALPALIVARNPLPVSRIEWIAALAGLFALLGETLADRQLARFRADPRHRGRTCRSGLWRYSRHPNYFFEWLVWCAMALLAHPAADGALAWVAPATLLLFILKISGIPPTEAQALRSRGADYREYQRTTSAFVPWFPRTTSPASAAGTGSATPGDRI